jgi:ribosomal protein S30
METPQASNFACYAKQVKNQVKNQAIWKNEKTYQVRVEKGAAGTRSCKSSGK